MSADVLSMPPVLDEERLAAYYIALSVQPEIAGASALVRTGVVNKVIAGMHLANIGRFRSQCPAEFPQEAKQRETVSALMAQDDAIAREKGWLW
jgi:hypothetical protein